VIFQYLFFETPQRGSHRRYLGNDIDAVAVLVDHLRQAADLALDPAQAFLARCLDVFSHAAYIPLQGMGYKWPENR
jgi:Cu+-exporting ATPase